MYLKGNMYYFAMTYCFVVWKSETTWSNNLSPVKKKVKSKKTKKEQKRTKQKSKLLIYRSLGVLWMFTVCFWISDWAVIIFFLEDMECSRKKCFCENRNWSPQLCREKSCEDMKWEEKDVLACCWLPGTENQVCIHSFSTKYRVFKGNENDQFDMFNTWHC